jgi:hypothetical protein
MHNSLRRPRSRRPRSTSFARLAATAAALCCRPAAHPTPGPLRRRPPDPGATPPPPTRPRGHSAAAHLTAGAPCRRPPDGGGTLLLLTRHQCAPAALGGSPTRPTPAPRRTIHAFGHSCLGAAPAPCAAPALCAIRAFGHSCVGTTPCPRAAPCPLRHSLPPRRRSCPRATRALAPALVPHPPLAQPGLPCRLRGCRIARAADRSP